MDSVRSSSQLPEQLWEDRKAPSGRREGRGATQRTEAGGLTALIDPRNDTATKPSSSAQASLPLGRSCRSPPETLR